MAKKMYVIQADDGMFFCGMRYWDKQLRKAKIYHSLTYAKDVVDAYQECNCKIVEVSLTIVPEVKTHADRLRAMSDEELAEWIVKKTKHQASAWSEPTYLNFLTESDDTLESAIKGTAEWLKQPAEDK